MRNRGSTYCGLCLPATFRLQGLATLLTVFSPQSRAGSVSHRQRSWDSPFGAFSFRKVSIPFPGGRTHLPFRLSVYPHRSGGRLGRPRFLGFAPSESPWRPGMVLTRGPLDAPLGFAPLGLPRTPRQGFRPASSRALLRPGLSPERRRPRVSIGVRSAPTSPAVARGDRLEHPSGVSAPACILIHSGRTATRAILFTSHRVAHYCRPTGALWMAWYPYRSCQDRLRCRAFALEQRAAGQFRLAHLNPRQ
jgi:hypothetical protein